MAVTNDFSEEPSIGFNPARLLEPGRSLTPGVGSGHVVAVRAKSRARFSRGRRKHVVSGHGKESRGMRVLIRPRDNVSSVVSCSDISACLRTGGLLLNHCLDRYNRPPPLRLEKPMMTEHHAKRIRD